MDPRAGLYRRSSSHHGRRHGTGSRESRLKKTLLATRVFTVITLVAIVILSLLLIRTSAELQTYNTESGTLASELKRAQAELEEAKRLVTAQEIELGALVKQRIPGVAPLELDNLYDINKGMMKKVSFSESGVGAARHLAYYAVLKNTSSTAQVPDVTILVFDRVGLQVGSARITKEAATPQAKQAALAPDESRTYTAPIKRAQGGEPEYFLVLQH